jgi:hypothetical protein
MPFSLLGTKTKKYVKGETFNCYLQIVVSALFYLSRVMVYFMQPAAHNTPVYIDQSYSRLLNQASCHVNVWV